MNGFKLVELANDLETRGSIISINECHTSLTGIMIVTEIDYLNVIIPLYSELDFLVAVESENLIKLRVSTSMGKYDPIHIVSNIPARIVWNILDFSHPSSWRNRLDLFGKAIKVLGVYYYEIGNYMEILTKDVGLAWASNKLREFTSEIIVAQDDSGLYLTFDTIHGSRINSVEEDNVYKAIEFTRDYIRRKGDTNPRLIYKVYNRSK